MNHDQTTREIDEFWESSILPTLAKYIEIPNQSPLFDPQWRENGHMMRAVELAKNWVLAQNIPGSRLEVLDEPGRTPVIVLEVDGEGEDTVLLYGHLDKQPAMVGWEVGLGPWQPVRRDGKLYGRGGADDGYAIFACVSAVKALQSQKIPHSNLVVLIECCEESGSLDLPYYVDKLSDRIGEPKLVVCLDSGCGDYDALWMTTSLRGSIVGNLHVQVLREGVHSGDASGIVPDSFRIIRQLLDRLEDARTGAIIPEWLHVEIPSDREIEIRKAAEILDEKLISHFPFVDGANAMSHDSYELLRNRTWQPMLAYTGQEGLPDLLQGGNVLRPTTSIKLSLRLPPTLDASDVDEKLKTLLESDPPYGAKVIFDPEKGGPGWNAPVTADWLRQSTDEASKAFFGRESASFGEGGSIPFMGMLGEKFPDAQFLVTGVLGPHSNAHGPNEFLHIEAGKKVTSSVAKVLADQLKNG